MTSTDDWTLVIGDAHVDPTQSLDRFVWLNRFIAYTPKIKRIVIIGDFVTIDSLSDWDRDKRKKMEGRRYKADIECGKEALDLMLKSVDTSIPIVFTEGNHEWRVGRYLDYNPELIGSIDIEEDLLSDTRRKREVLWVPYKDDWDYGGVSFTHVPIQESGKPVGGKTATARSLDIYQNTVVFGHTHKFDVACVHRHGAAHLNQAINVGCFFEHVDDYAKGSVTSYWRGFVMLNHYSTNRVDISTHALGWLKHTYGSNK